MGTVRIGTRGSPLALKQAETVKDMLAAARPAMADQLEIVTIRTSGDRIQDRALAEAGGKGLFTKEIERALSAGEVDMAVHSAKDVPTFLPDGLELSAFLPREDVRDMWISTSGKTIAEMPQGFSLGTASVRRQAQILALRPDLKPQLLRGNVETRLKKVITGDVDATLLACAGLSRLGMTVDQGTKLTPDDLLPAACQGIVTIECRAGDDQTLQLVQAINDKPSAVSAMAERAFLAELDGSCKSPIAAYAQPIDDDHFSFRGEILSADGSQVFRTSRELSANNAESAAREAAIALKKEAGEAFMTAFLAGPR